MRPSYERKQNRGAGLAAALDEPLQPSLRDEIQQRRGRTSEQPSNNCVSTAVFRSRWRRARVRRRARATKRRYRRSSIGGPQLRRQIPTSRSCHRRDPGGDPEGSPYKSTTAVDLAAASAGLNANHAENPPHILERSAAIFACASHGSVAPTAHALPAAALLALSVIRPPQRLRQCTGISRRHQEARVDPTSCRCRRLAC